MSKTILESIIDREIKEIIKQFPLVEKVLDEYNIGCAPCSAGNCLFGDIVKIHNLSPEDESVLMARIAKIIFPDREIEIPKVERKTVKSSELKYSPPIKKLVDEHKLIKRLLSLIPKICGHFDINKEEDKEIIRKCVEFIRNYADKFHHAKEEDILFKYFDENSDIIKTMSVDHEQGRANVRGILEGLDAGDRGKVCNNLAAYRDLLNEHIKKEDEILYTWMDRNLSTRKIGELFSKFNETDDKFAGISVKYEEFMNKLEIKFGG